MTTAKKRRRAPARRKSPAASATVAAAPIPVCELCLETGGTLLWSDKHCRVVLVVDPDYAGFCRVVWNEHVREMTDLSSARQHHCMRVVFAVEQALRKVLKPHKINLASFGNLTPHVHWHVIPRRVNDAHFPESVWGKRQRTTSRPGTSLSAPVLRRRLSAELQRLL